MNLEEQINHLVKRSEIREDLLEKIIKDSDLINNIPNKQNFLVLARTWNSWYPSSFNISGGCYFFNINEEIIIIDPGFNTLNEIKKKDLDIRLIRHIFITHFHPDHFESLIKLITRITSEINAINVYLNETSYKQFEIYGRDYTKFFRLKPDMSIKLNFEKNNPEFNVEVEVGKAFHKEIGGFDNSIGLKFKLMHNISKKEYKIGFMSDTDGSPENMDIYKKFYDECQILIIHLGAIHKDPTGYKHLYKRGIDELFKKIKIKNKNIFIGEYGFELATYSNYIKAFTDIIPNNILYYHLMRNVYQFITTDDMKNKNIQFLGRIYANIFYKCIKKSPHITFPNLELILPFFLFDNELIANDFNNKFLKEVRNKLNILIRNIPNDYNEIFMNVWNNFFNLIRFDNGTIQNCIDLIKNTLIQWNLEEEIRKFNLFIKRFLYFIPSEIRKSIINKTTQIMEILPDDNDNAKCLNFILLNVNDFRDKILLFPRIINFEGLGVDLKNDFDNDPKYRIFTFLFFIYFYLKLRSFSTQNFHSESETDGRELICKYYNPKKEYLILPVHPSYKIHFEEDGITIEGKDRERHPHEIPIEDLNKDWKIFPAVNGEKEYINIYSGPCLFCDFKTSINDFFSDDSMKKLPLDTKSSGGK